MEAFVLGLRFDWMILAYTMAIPFLSVVLICPFAKWRDSVLFKDFILFFSISSFLLVSLILAADTGYYSYFQDHLNILVFGLIDDDTWALIKLFWKNYPVIWIALASVVYTFLIFRWSRFALSRPAIDDQKFAFLSRFPRISFLVLSFLGLVFIGISGRGGFGLFPLGQTDTVISSHPFVNHLAFNGVHSLYRAVKLRKYQSQSWDINLRHFGYYSNPYQAFADFYQVPLEGLDHHSALNLLTKKTSEKVPFSQAHVIVIMMESFGSHYLQYEGPRFTLLGSLASHVNEGYFTLNMLPANQGTIGSISSLMVNFPQRALGAFLSESKHMTTPFDSAPAVLYKAQGYTTRFIYGGNPGWRDLHKFARFQGFDFVEGDVEIDRGLGGIKEKHDWGVYDEDVFKYVLDLLKNAKTPQMILVLTTTNHPPYETPRSFQADRLELPKQITDHLTTDLKIVKSRVQVFRYASEKLADFMSEIKSHPDLKDKTLVAVTGDHSFRMTGGDESQIFSKIAVPFYLHTPNKPSSLDRERIRFASHFDIFPTMYELTLPNVTYIGLGQNLLKTPADKQKAMFAGMFAANIFGAVQVQGVGQQSQYFIWDQEGKKLKPSEPRPELETLEKEYKAAMSLLDYYFEDQYRKKK